MIQAKLAFMVLAIVLTCLGVFLVGGGMSRMDYFALAFLSILFSQNLPSLPPRA